MASEGGALFLVVAQMSKKLMRDKERIRKSAHQSEFDSFGEVSFIKRIKGCHHEITQKIRIHRCGFAPMLTTWINYTIKCLHSIPFRDF